MKSERITNLMHWPMTLFRGRLAASVTLWALGAAFLVGASVVRLSGMTYPGHDFELIALLVAFAAMLWTGLWGAEAVTALATEEGAGVAPNSTEEEALP